MKTREDGVGRTMTLEERIDSFVLEEMTRSEAGAHAYDHVKRVHSIAMEIGRELHADLRVLGAAALLHDVGRFREEETGISHSKLSGDIGEGILRELEYTEAEIQGVKEAIRTHRFSENLTPTSLEGEILSDADKLDAMGAIGVFRAVAQAAVENAGFEAFLKHADAKLLKLHDLMYTETAREMAEERHKVLQSFVEELRRQLQDES
ncbi:MAG: HD domain-containing protein [Promethearchaeota archaeon]